MLQAISEILHQEIAKIIMKDIIKRNYLKIQALEVFRATTSIVYASKNIGIVYASKNIGIGSRKLHLL